MRWFLAAVLVGAIAYTQEASHTVWDGVFTRSQAQRGEALYNQECAACHGKVLEGDSLAPPLSGSIFLSGWDGERLGKLFVRISRDMADPDQKLDSGMNADILAYILACNGFPDGAKELPRTVASLDQIRFQATKPEGKK